MVIRFIGRRPEMERYMAVYHKGEENVIRFQMPIPYNNGRKYRLYLGETDVTDGFDYSNAGYIHMPVTVKRGGMTIWTSEPLWVDVVREEEDKLSEGKPYQQYVTDGEGKAKWEERTHYRETKRVYWDGKSLPTTTLSKSEESDSIYRLQDSDMPYQDMKISRPDGDGTVKPNYVRVSCEYGIFEGNIDQFSESLPLAYGIDNVMTTNVSDPSQSMDFTCQYRGHESNGLWYFEINSASGVDFGNAETVTVDVTFMYATEETTIVPIPAEYLPSRKHYYLYDDVLYHDAEHTQGVTVEDLKSATVGHDIVSYDDDIRKSVIVYLCYAEGEGYYINSSGDASKFKAIDAPEPV